MNSLMPAEWMPHERCLMGWPGRDQVPTRLIAGTREAHAAVAKRLAEFEPVLMVAHPGFGRQAATLCGPRVEVLEVPLGTSWMRDAAPLFVLRGGEVVAVDFQFNSWGDTLPPYEGSIGDRLCRRLGIPREPVPLVLEGGSIAVDGHGTLVAVESSVLSADRNPEATRSDFEDVFGRLLGANRTVWLPGGLPDDGTGGHADNVVAFVGPGRILAQLPEHRSRLEAAGLEVVPFDVPASRVRYLNFYVGNGCVLVPQGGEPADGDALAILREHFPGREVVGLDGLALAAGGGGIHCITQPIPQV